MGNLVFAAGAGSFYTLATGQQFHADTIEPVSDAPNLDLPVGAEGTTLLGVRFTGTVTHTGTEASVWVDANISDDPDRNACSGSLVYLPLKVSS